MNTPELAALCREEQEVREQHDAWEPIVSQWLCVPVIRFLDTDGRERQEDISQAVAAERGLNSSDILQTPRPSQVTN